MKQGARYILEEIPNIIFCRKLNISLLKQWKKEIELLVIKSKIHTQQQQHPQQQQCQNHQQHLQRRFMKIRVQN